MRTREELKLLQALPLDVKVMKTKLRIREWVDAFGMGGVCVSFSGGKDSTVLLNIVREMYGNDIPAVFVDTGLEYPEVRSFVKKFDNAVIVRPKMKFVDVIKTYGYPVIGKEAAERIENAKRCVASGGKRYIEHYYQIYQSFPNEQAESLYGDRFQNRYSFAKWRPLVDVDFRISSQCCLVMKKTPIKEYERDSGRHPITAQMAIESRLRTTNWLKNGCNAFDAKMKVSNPMSFWTEQDVLRYIKLHNIDIASVYGDIIPVDGQLSFDERECSLCTTGCNRTGCVFCGFGAHSEKGETRFERLHRTHPKLYEYCMYGGAYDDSDGLWKPDNRGLGMKHVFDTLNDIYGIRFIRY